MKIHVSKTTDPRDYERVEPNFIYNRFDLFAGEGEFEAVTISCGDRVKVVEYGIREDTVELGLWLTPITEAELEQLILYVTKTHPTVTKIKYRNGMIPYGKAKKQNHFRIEFPATVEEMESRVTTHSRYKMRKKARFAERDYGPMQILEYDSSNLPEEIVETFFDFKRAIRSREYDLTAAEYLDRYHVSHCYVVKFGDTIGAIRFSCEQCPIVYGENFAYNPALRAYSLGRYIFYYHLIRMVEKQHSQLFFAGGDYEYKTHYGSIEETAYDCTIQVDEIEYRTFFDLPSQVRRVKRHLKKLLKQ